MATTSAIKPKRTRHNTNCCVLGCHSRKEKDRKVHFHYFPPKDTDVVVTVKNKQGIEEKVNKRTAWENALMMGKPVTPNMRVCSKHFRNEDYCSYRT